MSKRFLTLALVAFMLLPLAIVGCKGKVENPEGTLDTSASMPEAMSMSPAGETLATPEPAQTVATETIPPSAAPQMAGRPVQQQAASREKEDRNKDIQTALKNAGLYTGAIDGKLGPKTKKAIEDFQRSNGLKVDGKVGPKTWAELEKYLAQQ
ncbi:MAG: peptidoglycan-binding domain-containing protein [Candidatus Omnitrophica bacterium]|nr:peptidoglycan-binding domain-containing protein [Candidatus Omnitrophota bacterium]MDD5436901.1 peptidoglycan-binding domain-containing protein [Candidatus Omnitrophota bacterium]